MRPSFSLWLALVIAPAAYAQEPAAAPTEGTAEEAGTLLSLRTATADQLATLEHVDGDTAARIVALREERGGRLGSVEELRVLPGLGEATLDSLRSGTAVEIEFPVGSTKTYTTVDEVMAEFDDEPSVQQVQGWATEYARVAPKEVDGWMSSSRTFALLPDLQLEYRLVDGWDKGFQYYPADGVIDEVDEGVFDVEDDAGTDQTRTIAVKARWELDKLILSSERIRVMNETQDAVKLRDKVLTEVTRLYFERRRLQVELLLRPKSDLSALAKDQLRLMELTANLDALTGGTFSEALLKAR